MKIIRYSLNIQKYFYKEINFLKKNNFKPFILKFFKCFDILKKYSTAKYKQGSLKEKIQKFSKIKKYSQRFTHLTVLC